MARNAKSAPRRMSPAIGETGGHTYSGREANDTIVGSNRAYHSCHGDSPVTCILCKQTGGEHFHGGDRTVKRLLQDPYGRNRESYSPHSRRKSRAQQLT